MTLSDIKQDVSKGVVPLILVIVMTVAAASMAFGVGVVFSNLTRDTAQSRQDILSLKTDIALVQSQIAQVQADVSGLASHWQAGERWTRNEQTRFCLEAEIRNPGWSCPDFNGSTSRRTQVQPEKRKYAE